MIARILLCAFALSPATGSIDVHTQHRVAATTPSNSVSKSGKQSVESLAPGSPARRKRCEAIARGKERLPKGDFRHSVDSWFDKMFNECVEMNGGPVREIILTHCDRQAHASVVDYCTDPGAAPARHARQIQDEKVREVCASTLQQIVRGTHTPHGVEVEFWDLIKKPWQACMAEYGYRQESAVVCANRGVADPFMTRCIEVLSKGSDVRDEEPAHTGIHLDRGTNRSQYNPYGL